MDRPRPRPVAHERARDPHRRRRDREVAGSVPSGARSGAVGPRAQAETARRGRVDRLVGSAADGRRDRGRADRTAARRAVRRRRRPAERGGVVPRARAVGAGVREPHPRRPGVARGRARCGSDVPAPLGRCLPAPARPAPDRRPRPGPDRERRSSRSDATEPASTCGPTPIGLRRMPWYSRRRRSSPPSWSPGSHPAPPRSWAASGTRARASRCSSIRRARPTRSPRRPGSSCRAGARR